MILVFYAMSLSRVHRGRELPQNDRVLVMHVHDTKLFS